MVFHNISDNFVFVSELEKTYHKSKRKNTKGHSFQNCKISIFTSCLRGFVQLTVILELHHFFLEKSLVCVILWKPTEIDIHLFWAVGKQPNQKNMYIKYIVKHCGNKQKWFSSLKLYWIKSHLILRLKNFNTMFTFKSLVYLWYVFSYYISCKRPLETKGNNRQVTGDLSGATVMLIL